MRGKPGQQFCYCTFPDNIQPTLTGHFPGWLGWVMVLGIFQCRGILLLLHILGQGPAVLAAGAGRVGYIFYIFHLSSVSNVLQGQIQKFWNAQNSQVPNYRIPALTPFWISCRGRGCVWTKARSTLALPVWHIRQTLKDSLEQNYLFVWDSCLRWFLGVNNESIVLNRDSLGLEIIPRWGNLPINMVLRSEGSLKLEMLSLARTSKYVDNTSVLSIKKDRGGQLRLKGLIKLDSDSVVISMLSDRQNWL